MKAKRKKNIQREHIGFFWIACYCCRDQKQKKNSKCSQKLLSSSSSDDDQGEKTKFSFLSGL